MNSEELKHCNYARLLYLGRIKMKKWSPKVSPENLVQPSTSSSMPGKSQLVVLTEEELEVKYGLGREDDLDLSLLPPPRSLDFIGLSKLPRFQAGFSATAVRGLTTLEGLLKGMLDQVAMVGGPFLPQTPDPNPADHKMTEMESLFFVLLETLRLTKEKTAKGRADFTSQCLAALTGLRKGLKALTTTVEAHRRELKTHRRRLAMVQCLAKADYPRALRPAADLFEDFCLHSDELKGPIGLKEPMSSEMKFRCQPNGYAVYSRLPEREPAWRDGITFDPETQRSMMDGVLAEFGQRIQSANRGLKAGLSQILRMSGGDEPTGIRLELDRLSRLFEYRRLKLSPSGPTTILFVLLRVEHRFGLLNNTLRNLIQSLIVLKSRVKYVTQNLVTWQLMTKKLVYGPISYLAETKNYAMLQVPIRTKWAGTCARDFIFEAEPEAVLVPVPEFLEHDLESSSSVLVDPLTSRGEVPKVKTEGEYGDEDPEIEVAKPIEALPCPLPAGAEHQGDTLPPYSGEGGLELKPSNSESVDKSGEDDNDT